jgi:hypothetical protein
LNRSLGIALAIFTFTPGTALAYCRTTTCDPSLQCDESPDDCCMRDEHGCDTNGLVLAWPTSCVSYAIQEDGSAKRGISAAELSTIVDQAFDTWMGVSCDAGLSLSVENYGEVACRESEFNTDLGNANIWMFRDSGWLSGSAASGSDGFDSSALAVTVTSFSRKNGQLYDADVELNADQVDFTLPDDTTNFDLLSIVTHEAGHFLGLDHSPVPEATMFYAYNPPSISARTLSDDDVAGLCSAYPTDREIPNGSSCDPRRGFETKCLYNEAPAKGGCTVQSGPSRSSSGAWLAVAFGLSFWVARRTRLKRPETASL